MSTQDNNKVKISEVPVGTVLGRLDMVSSRSKQEGNRYMVVLRDSDTGTEKALLNLRNFKVVGLSATWRAMDFQVLDTEITIHDHMLTEILTGD
jgi:hypothetical protein